jgi:NADPH:quinone reductase-like Zn-dependent oxidoreductase
MRAVVVSEFGGPEVLVVRDVPEPELREPLEQAAEAHAAMEARATVGKTLLRVAG